MKLAYMKTLFGSTIAVLGTTTAGNQGQRVAQVVKPGNKFWAWPTISPSPTTSLVSIDFDWGAGFSWGDGAPTASADYETGTKIGDFTTANNKYRFIGDTSAGFDYLTVDLTTTVKDRYPATKGVYVHSLYSGAEIQLAQAPEVIENGIKLDVLKVELEDIKGMGFDTDKQSLVKLRQHITNSNQI